MNIAERYLVTISEKYHFNEDVENAFYTLAKENSLEVKDVSYGALRQFYEGRDYRIAFSDGSRLELHLPTLYEYDKGIYIDTGWNI